MSYEPVVEDRADRYRISVADYVHYQKEGYLIVRNLVSQEDIERIRNHAMDILFGRVLLDGLEPPSPNATQEELIHRFSRVHMLHLVDKVSEEALLHPRVLDVVEALTGPDVLALQSMLFFNAPGMGGQGWHQDSYYITTFPDTLMGAWIALDRADEENGCLWVAPGSQNEPVYPDHARKAVIHASGVFADLPFVDHTSHLDDDINELAPIARKWPEKAPAVMEPGDVLFFPGQVLHRSYPNKAKERWRRAFVNHYCNARAWVPWNHGAPFDGEAANDRHILARGKTHLPFATPRFGTPCAATAQAPHAPVSSPSPEGLTASAPEFAWNKK
ncbi:MAG: phytanoyl-CoA dioxygenase family protein [Armatimonadetes bacterium]|nr:phytanoyl-CoA dioxygenase family protein [Armatimonadota bacterium]